eukprot:COSAG01_NODE_16528_length_1229_cov_1.553982_1_plen_93_part_10
MSGSSNGQQLLVWREVLCLRSRIRRGDAVYTMLEELRFASRAPSQPVSTFQRPVGFDADPRHALRAALQQSETRPPPDSSDRTDDSSSSSDAE